MAFILVCSMLAKTQVEVNPWTDERLVEKNLVEPALVYFWMNSDEFVETVKQTELWIPSEMNEKDVLDLTENLIRMAMVHAAEQVYTLSHVYSC